jgi:prolyl oligopeptidase
MLVDLEDYRQTFIIKKTDLLQGGKKWKALYSKDDKVRSLQLYNNDAFFFQDLIQTTISFVKPTLIVQTLNTLRS